MIVAVIGATPGVGLNISPEMEEEGLDVTQIGEQAYDENLSIVQVRCTIFWIQYLNRSETKGFGRGGGGEQIM